MRLFLGVELSPELKAAAAAAASTFKVALGRSLPSLDVRWVDAEKLHVTLWFLGEVKDDRFPTLATNLQPPFRTSAFTLALAGVGAFPPSGAPRVFWLGIQRGSDSLRELHAEIAGRLVPLGFEPERREYSAHLTIGRVKDPGRLRRPSLRETMETASGEVGACTVTSVTLFRSRLSPKGSTYEALMRIPLG